MTKDLKREILDLIDLVHDLLHQGENESQETRRLFLKLPDAWRTLAAWLAIRRRMELRGTGGPSPWPVDVLPDQTLSLLSRNYIGFVLNEHFHAELHALATGTHPILRHPPVNVTNTKGEPL